MCTYTKRYIREMQEEKKVELNGDEVVNVVCSFYTTCDNYKKNLDQSFYELNERAKQNKTKTKNFSTPSYFINFEVTC